MEITYSSGQINIKLNQLEEDMLKITKKRGNVQLSHFKMKDYPMFNDKDNFEQIVKESARNLAELRFVNMNSNPNGLFMFSMRNLMEMNIEK